MNNVCYSKNFYQTFSEQQQVIHQMFKRKVNFLPQNCTRQDKCANNHKKWQDLGPIARTPLNRWVYLTGHFKYT